MNNRKTSQLFECNSTKNKVYLAEFIASLLKPDDINVPVSLRPGSPAKLAVLMARYQQGVASEPKNGDAPSIFFPGDTHENQSVSERQET